MLYLYLDESGDLGFDFVNKKPSKYFTICVMVIDGIEENRRMSKFIKKTIYRRIGDQDGIELKGSNTSIAIKKYFYELCCKIDFKVFAITLNKKRVYERLTEDKERVYNFIARNVIDKIPIKEGVDRINLVVDKSKSKPEITDFNEYIMRAIKGRIDPGVPLDIEHHLSHENKCIQAVDLFCWGIFRKYEKKDEEWFKIYHKKVRYESLYLSHK
ncbi:MAG: hypothetical protein A2044_00230 [Candidatus Firestonebacteria bacterium GWA2_43_8]|nr:MAG: hypothetical protein A2044_00230 [Candidatus Firestonebacteria bacterium GWA2_43_8]